MKEKYKMPLLLIQAGIGVLFLGLGIWGVTAVGAPLPFTSGILAAQETRIRNLQDRLSRTVEASQQLADELAPMRSYRGMALAADGAVAAASLRERAEKSFGRNNLRVRSMGDVRCQVLNDQVALYELDFTAEGTSMELIGLLEDFYRSAPRLYWRSSTIKPAGQLESDLLTVTATVAMLNWIPGASEEEKEP